VALAAPAHARRLERAGVNRQHADEQAGAIGRFLMPDPATRVALTAGLSSLEQRRDARIQRAENRIPGVVAAIPGVSFAPLKSTPS
jgi:hypothetical protein